MPRKSIQLVSPKAHPHLYRTHVYVQTSRLLTVKELRRFIAALERAQVAAEYANVDLDELSESFGYPVCGRITKDKHYCTKRIGHKSKCEALD